MNILRKLSLLLIVAVLFGACQPVVAPAATSDGGAQPAAADPAAMPDLGTLQIAYLPGLGMAPFFVAADKGYFVEQGLTVELQNVRNVDEMLAPISTGKIDVALMTATTGFLNAMNQKLDFRVVAGVADPQVPPPSAPVVAVRKALSDSGEVTEMADLKGRKVAINLRGSALEFLIYRGLQQAGLTLDDVEFVTIPGTQMLAALENSAVDAVVAGGLNMENMIAQEAAVPLLSTGDLPSVVDGRGIVFGQRLLDPANREVAIRILVAYLQAARFLNDGGWEEPEVIASLQKYTGMEPAMINRAVKDFFAADGVIDETSLMELQAFQVEQGYVEYTDAIPAAAMIDVTMVSEAVARLEQQ